MSRIMNFPSDLFLRYPVSIASRARRAGWRLLGVRFTGRADLRRISIPRNPWDISLGACALLNDVVLVATGERRSDSEGGPRIVISDGVIINSWTMVDAAEKIEIGECVFIGPHGYITDHDHGTAAPGPVAMQPLVSAPTRIGRNSWLGAHVTVLKGVSIGENSIVAAGAVVIKDVPAGAIVAGVPAKVVGWRGESKKESA